MKTLLLALVLAVGIQPVAAAETARGSFKSQNLGMTIKSALAFPGTSLLDKTPVIVVAVTSAEMDTDALAAYYDRRRAIDRRVKDNDTGVVFVEFKPDGRYRGYSFYFARGNGCGIAAAIWASRRRSRSPTAGSRARSRGSTATATSTSLSTFRSGQTTMGRRCRRTAEPPARPTSSITTRS
jgi:hypothetical protein